MVTVSYGTMASGKTASTTDRADSTALAASLCTMVSGKMIGITGWEKPTAQTAT
jgi:thymidine kinase